MGALGVVFDTNVLVSALGFGGTPLDALLRAFQDDVELLVSSETLDELARVMTYERLPFTAADRAQFLTILRREATVVDPSESLAVVDEDPDDDAFIECAVAGDAEYLVSGDDHLLDRGGFRDVRIVTPREFLSLMAD